MNLQTLLTYLSPNNNSSTNLYDQFFDKFIYCNNLIVCDHPACIPYVTDSTDSSALQQKSKRLKAFAESDIVNGTLCNKAISIYHFIFEIIHLIVLYETIGFKHIEQEVIKLTKINNLSSLFEKAINGLSGLFKEEISSLNITSETDLNAVSDVKKVVTLILSCFHLTTKNKPLQTRNAEPIRALLEDTLFNSFLPGNDEKKNLFVKHFEDLLLKQVGKQNTYMLDRLKLQHCTPTILLNRLVEVYLGLFNPPPCAIDECAASTTDKSDKSQSDIANLKRENEILKWQKDLMMRLGKIFSTYEDKFLKNNYDYFKDLDDNVIKDILEALSKNKTSKEEEKEYER